MCAEAGKFRDFRSGQSALLDNGCSSTRQARAVFALASKAAFLLCFKRVPSIRMAKSAWPTGSELSAAVVGMGSAIPAGFTAADIIAGAIEEFERLTGWEPFLADAGSDTRQYDPTYGFTLRTDHFFTVTSVTVAGVTKTEGTDYWVLPYNNALREKPITGLRFLTPLQGLPREVSVTGRLGYDDEIHLDAWNAVLKRAVAQCLELAAGPSGSVAEIEQGLVKVKYGQEAGRGTIDRFNNEFKQVVRRYKRADVF